MKKILSYLFIALIIECTMYAICNNINLKVVVPCATIFMVITIYQHFKK
jgi:hypothetical protein